MDNEQIVVKKNEKVINNNKHPTLISQLKNLFSSNQTNHVNNEKQEKTNENNNDCLNEKVVKTTEFKKSGFITKFFKNKHAKVAIIVLIFAVAALIILNSSFGTGLTSTSNNKSDLTYMSSLEYCEKLEQKLMDVFSKISGVGNVKVMVTVASAPELIIASSSDEKTNTTSNGTSSTTSSTTSKEPIIVTNSGVNSPLVLTEKVPEVTGVVVVAEGAKDVKIKLSLLEAVQALLQVKSSNIQIYY